MNKLQIIKPQLFKILAVIFAILTAVSAMNVYYALQLPLYSTITTTLCTYQHIGTYNYTAKLIPNMIYNKTTLKPGEGTLYTSIVDHLNMTFAYAFTSTPKPTNFTIDSYVTTQLESPEKWTRTLTDDEAEELLELRGSQSFSVNINQTKIREVVDLIDSEIGIHSKLYNLKIIPEVQIKAKILYNQIEETFKPEIVISFISGSESGSYISIENLQQKEEKYLTRESVIYLMDVEARKIESYFFTSISTIFTAFITIMYLINKPAVTKIKPIKKIIDPHRELISETSEKPPETERTINFKSLEDLAKTAEILTRPIMYVTYDNDHIFYIIDGNIKYLYETKTT